MKEKPKRENPLKDPRILLGALSLVLVVWLTAADLERNSPGPLTTTHSQVAKLNATDSCDACHGEGGLLRADRSMDAACGDCHTGILVDVEQGSGIHGLLEVPRDCGACHIEHHGDQIALITPAALLAAGIPNLEEFDHAQLDFRLEGKHAEAKCEACHPNAHVDLLPEGERRFHGLVQTCEACHEDPHNGQMVPACAACHGQALPFAEVATFAHAEFDLKGAHSQATCLDCHESGSIRSVEALASRAPGDHGGPRPRDCAACHGSPHAPTFVAGVSADLRLAPGQSCATCHSPALADFATLPDTTTASLHGAGGFVLDGKHRQPGCADCHQGASFEARFRDRDLATCVACHGDPHGAQFLAELRDADAPRLTGCVECHDTEGFAPSTFGIAQHEQSGFPLVDSHAQADCALCHLKQPDSQSGSAAPLPLGLVDRSALVADTTRFRGLESGCSDCHLNAHLEPEIILLASADSGSRPDFAACERCHREDTFKETIPGSFDHSRDTDFVLDGAHATAECSVCHLDLDRPDASGRLFGRASLQFGEPTDRCATCHSDPHRLAGEDAFFPLGTSAPERDRGCGLCHDTTNFAVTEEGAFSHTTQAGFPLRGAHEEAACEACHLPQARPDANGRLFGFVTAGAGQKPGSCLNCHMDPHAGGFSEGRGMGNPDDCARCHTDLAFSPHRPGSFEHGRDTGIPLSEAHADVSCEECHAKSEQPDLLGRSFGRALGSLCSDCHSDPHLGQFLIDDSNDCARCHASDGSAALFDHDRDARYPLDERHRELDCAQCHRTASLSDGRSAVRYKPLGTECADCHGTRVGD